MNLEELIQQIKKRPGMYVGCIELEPVVHFINGFIFSNLVADRIDNVEMEFKEKFHDWARRKIEKRYNIKLEEHRNYLFYIKHVSIDSEENLKIFFQLCEDFFEELHKRENVILYTK